MQIGLAGLIFVIIVIIIIVFFWNISDNTTRINFQQKGGGFTSDVGTAFITICIFVLLLVLPAFLGLTHSPSFYIF